MEGVLVRMHVQRVDRQIVGCQFERLEYLLQRQFSAIAEYYNIL